MLYWFKLLSIMQPYLLSIDYMQFNFKTLSSMRKTFKEGQERRNIRQESSTDHSTGSMDHATGARDHSIETTDQAIGSMDNSTGATDRTTG